MAESAIIYAGWSVEELLAERTRLQEAIGSGRVQTWSALDASSGRTFEVPLLRALAFVQEALYALDPNTYADPSEIYVKRTRTRFV
jgi:hypothetical protein